jgi:uncharacterized membrane protein YozB (DUF420 family)
MKSIFRATLIPYILSAALALVALACFAVPMYVIRPFRHQGAQELAVALFVKQIGVTVCMACSVLALALGYFIWSRSRRWQPRAATAACVLLTFAGIYLTKLNVYELMFHPVDSPQFQNAAHAKVDGDDMVLDVKVKGVYRAYPIREIAYHHVINDVVAGEPIVSTY